jgi:hypothetical protein
MTIVLYHAVGQGLDYTGKVRDEVIGRAGDFWSMQRIDAPVEVYAVMDKVRWLIWQDGRPWPWPYGRSGKALMANLSSPHPTELEHPPSAAPG